MKPWLNDCAARLAACAGFGYRAGDCSATEPTALAALALRRLERVDGVDIKKIRFTRNQALDWLLQAQQSDGRLGISRDQTNPGWPTSLAIWAWSEELSSPSPDSPAPRHKQFLDARDQALSWLLATKGAVITATEPLSHNRMLVGWPWIEGTHSWIEPTALCVLALKAAGKSDHERTREAVTLLIDRLLPDGGCNYGNTFVLGQKLLPHLQPTGMCLLALAGEKTTEPRVGHSLDYLQRLLSPDTAPVSLAWSLMALAAHGRAHAKTDQWLAAAHARLIRRDPSPYKLALIALAGARDQGSGGGAEKT